jgi:hypothetical protein
MAHWRYVLWAVDALGGPTTWRVVKAQGTLTEALREQLRGATRSYLVSAPEMIVVSLTADPLHRVRIAACWAAR